jgi:hypothetical protein
MSKKDSEINDTPYCPIAGYYIYEIVFLGMKPLRVRSWKGLFMKTFLNMIILVVFGRLVDSITVLWWKNKNDS